MKKNFFGKVFRIQTVVPTFGYSLRGIDWFVRQSSATFRNSKVRGRMVSCFNLFTVAVEWRDDGWVLEPIHMVDLSVPISETRAQDEQYITNSKI